MAKVTYLTEEGLQRLKDELDQLTSVKAPNISNMIAEARDKGDLSENAEYDAAKEAQGLLEMKIAKLQDLISKLRVIDESKIDLTSVQILNRVKIKNKTNNTILDYLIVPESEADIKNGKISVETPIAKGLLGKVIGDIAEIRVPAGMMKFEILEISR